MYGWSSLMALLVLSALACGTERNSPARSSGAPPVGGTPTGDDEPDDDVVVGEEGGAPATGGSGGGVVSGAGATSATSGGAADGTGEPVTPAMPVSEFCGDAIRDPVAEACDDGSDDGMDSCSPGCEVRNLLVVAEPTLTNLSRRLGFGRHPLAANTESAALVYMEVEGSNTSIHLARFNDLGQRAAEPLSLSAGLKPSEDSHPVVAALPGERYVAAWGDISAGSLDVILRPIAATADVGDSVRANESVAGAQYDPDLIWIGGELVAAWTDMFGIKIRTFSEQLAPTSDEWTLSSAPFAGSVALAAHAGTWAAVFRESADAGREQIAVVLGDGTRFVVGPVDAGPTYQRPSLVSLDDEHLLLVFSVAQADAFRLHGAILNAAAPDDVAMVNFPMTLPPYESDQQLDQTHPGLARIGDRILLTWQSTSPLGNTLNEELFLRELSWSASSPTALALTPEYPLPLDWPRQGTQRAPAIEAATFKQGHTLLTAFEHVGVVANSAATIDLVLGFVPRPTLATSSPTEGP